MDNFNAQYPTRVRVWVRLTLIGLFAGIALIGGSLLHQPAQAVEIQAAPPLAPHPAASINTSGVRHSVGILNFESGDLNTYINDFFVIDGTNSYLGSCPPPTAHPRWTGVVSGTLLNTNAALAYKSSKAIWFGDPVRGDYGGPGGDENPGNPCVNPIFTGTLTTIATPIMAEDRAILSFWSWEETEMSIEEEGFECYQLTQCEFDARRVWIKRESASEWEDVKWTTELSAFPHTVEKQWHQVVIDISEYMGDSIQIRFEFNAIDRRNNNYLGWFIDDIKIETFEINNNIFLPILRK